MRHDGTCWRAVTARAFFTPARLIDTRGLHLAELNALLLPHQLAEERAVFPELAHRSCSSDRHEDREDQAAAASDDMKFQGRSSSIRFLR